MRPKKSSKRPGDRSKILPCYPPRWVGSEKTKSANAGNGKGLQNLLTNEKREEKISMAKTKKENQAAADQESATPLERMPVRPVEPSDMMQVEPRDYLFDLYVARVAKAETVNTMRRDGRAIFRDAFIEARVALDVYLEQMGVKS